jgi:hypothetical protein
MDEDFVTREVNWSRDPKDWYWLEGGFAIPERFTVPAETPDWAVEVVVEVRKGKARTRSITISTDAPEGVTAAMIRRVPIREIVARGALNVLRRPQVEEDGTTKLKPFMTGEEEQAYSVLDRVVRYVDVEDAVAKPATIRAKADVPAPKVTQSKRGGRRGGKGTSRTSEPRGRS